MKRCFLLVFLMMLLITAFPAIANPEDFVIEDGVLTSYTGNDVNVEIPSGVISIGSNAFKSNTKIVSVIIPAGVTSIEPWAFYGCHKLQNVTLPAGLLFIGRDAFEYCYALKEITIPDSVEEIGYSAFYHSGLTEITLPNSMPVAG